MQLTIDKKKTSSNETDARPIFMQDDELIAQCPSCKTMETVYFSSGKLVSTLKFYSDDSRVYHKCGSSEACRLY